LEKIFKAMVVSEIRSNRFKREISLKSLDELPDNDLTVQVKYSSLNYKDMLSATGDKGVTKNYPHTPGIDAAGVIIESNTDKFKAGDEVIITGYDLGQNTSGGFGQIIRVPSSWVIKLPINITMKESMIYGTAGLTAAMSIHKLELNGLNPSLGEVLVTGATGGVGSIAIGILSKLGYKVVAVTGKVNEKDYLTKLGAIEIIDRRDLYDPYDKPLGKRRWAGVVDTVGGNILSTAIKTTKDGGSVSCCGMVLSSDLNTTIFPFIIRGISLLGIASAEYPLNKKAILWEKLAGPWKLDCLDHLSNETNLDNLNTYIDIMIAGKSRGRVIVNLS